MDVRVVTDERGDVEALCASLVAALNGASPSWIGVGCSVHVDGDALLRAMGDRFPGVPVHGTTSCLGVMSHEGFLDGPGSIGAIAVVDASGRYGLGASELGQDARNAAAVALEAALDRADEPGALPSIVWVNSSPGHEEDVIAGIESVVGPHVPIVGGSAADDDVSGGWSVFFDDGERRGSSADGVVVSAWFPSDRVGSSFHSGYGPTAHAGRVTASEGRVVHAIDGRPAAEVYGEWTEGRLGDCLDQPGGILADTTLTPLGRRVGAGSWQLAHPDAVVEGGGLSLFARVDVGDELVLMHGTTDSLSERAGRVAHAAMAAGSLRGEEVAGAMVIYCAGCMLTVRERMDEVVASLQGALGQQPFLGLFSFGEQGCFLGGENRHGNLMISVLVLAR